MRTAGTAAPASLASTAVVVAIMLYLTGCFLAVRYLVGFGLAWVVAAGAVAGVLTVVVALVVTLAGAGWRAPRTIGPDPGPDKGDGNEDRNDAAPAPSTRLAVRPDHAWPNYLVAQAWEDLRTAARNICHLQAEVWTPAHRCVREDLPCPLAWWPVLVLLYGGLLAYSAGVLVAGAGLLGLAAVVLVATWLVWFAVVGAARGLDILVRKARKASGSCPHCYHVTSLPGYDCPCGEVHRDIRPGRLGALSRRCGCGRLLPTTVLRAAGTLAGRCPRCDKPLRPGAAVLTEVRLPVFGPASAGKTRLVFAGLEALRQEVTAAGGEFSPTDEDSRRELASGAQVVISNADTTKTAAGEPPVTITVRVSGGRRRGLVHVYDAAGELFADRERHSCLRFLDQAQGLVFALDPFSIPRLADELARSGAARLAAARPATEDPETAYRLTAQRLRDHGARLRSLAVTVVKADLLLDLPPAVGLTTDSDVVRAWLVGQSLENLTSAAERDFADVRYFLVSSRTGWRADDPLSAAGPLLWLAGRAGLPIAWPQPLSRAS